MSLKNFKEVSSNVNLDEYLYLYNYVRDNIEYDESITGRLGPIMVRKEYVGKGLQTEMLKVLNEYVKNIEKTHMFTKAHSDNIYSIRNILKDGYKIIDEYVNEKGPMTAFVK